MLSGQRPGLPLKRQDCDLRSSITRFPVMFILMLMKFSRRDSVFESIFYLVFNGEDSLELKLMFPQSLVSKETNEQKQTKDYPKCSQISETAVSPSVKCYERTPSEHS